MTDLEFARKCAKGNKQSWDEFITRYSRLIYNYIHAVLNVTYIGSYSSDSIRDIFQEIFLLLVKDNFKKLKTFKAINGCSLASWLRQLVINHTIDYVRRTRRQTVSLNEENEDELTLKEILADDNILISEKLAQDEILVQLEECIQALSNDDKYFVAMHFKHNVGLNELANLYRLSRGAMDMRKARVVKKLKECFRKKGLTFYERVYPLS